MGLFKLDDPRSLVRLFDIPQERELSTCVSTFQGFVKNAIGALMEKLEQDFSSVNARRNWLLEVWQFHFATRSRADTY